MIAIGRFKIETGKSGSKLIYRLRHTNNVDIKITLNHVILDFDKWDTLNQSFKFKRN